MLEADFAPPRELYGLFLPAVLACTGVLSWVMSNPQGMVLAAVVGTAVALFTLWDWIYREGPTRLSTLLGMALLIGYAMGTLNTWITLPRGSLTLAVLYGLERGVLARGLGAALMSAATLYFLGEMFEKPLFARNFRFRFDNRTRNLIYLGALAMLAGYATHSLGFAGVNASGGHESIFGAVLYWCYSPFTALSVAALVTSRTRKEQVLSALSVLIYLLALSVMGRRYTIYTTLLILWALPLAGFRLRGLRGKKLVLLAALVGVMVISALTFMLLRIAGYSITGNLGKQATIAQRVEVARGMVQSGGGYTQALASTQTNLQSRTFILAFFSNILDASSRMPPAMGKDASGLFQLAVPSVIDPGKNKYFAEEELDDTQFGFGYKDEANSVLTAGSTDFGFAGVLIYPLLLVLLFRVVYDFLMAYMRTTVRIIGAMAIIVLFLQTEVGLGGYFSYLRDTILFCILLAVLLALPSFRAHAAERHIH